MRANHGDAEGKNESRNREKGLFTYVTGLGRPKYTEAIISGRAIAGALPPLAQILTVLVVFAKHSQDGKYPADGKRPLDPKGNPCSALAYFMPAAAVSVISLLAFFFLLRKCNSYSQTHSTIDHATKAVANGTSRGSAVNRNLSADTGNYDPPMAEPSRESIPLTTRFRKLHSYCLLSSSALA
jgi:hypothetical protein